ncbi:MAG: peroxiredoxin [Litoreibacter sp.]|nr:peroxiredoxin [Litoreibacter sp.]
MGNQPFNSSSVPDWSDLPQPQDDGGAAHLEGMTLPSVALTATDGTQVDLSSLKGRSVVYAYPMTGRPDRDLPEGWDMIPGARGCTPQSCAFRDHFAELRELGVAQLFGLSTQSAAYQSEAAERLHLPFALLSDADLALATALKLPVMEVEGDTLLRRLTMVVDDGVIVKVFYPVFPPSENATIVIDWLRQT